MAFIRMQHFRVLKLSKDCINLPNINRTICTQVKLRASSRIIGTFHENVEITNFFILLSKKNLIKTNKKKHDSRWIINSTLPLSVRICVCMVS